MAKRAAKDSAAGEGKVVEIVTRTTERRTGDDAATDEIDLGAAETGGGDDDVMAILADLGDTGARLEVRRTSPAEFAGYVGSYNAEGFTPDRLLEEWGGGKYSIRVRAPGGQLHGMRHIQLAGKPKNREDKSAAAPVAAAPVGDGMAQVLATIQAGQKASADATNGQIALLTTLLTSLISREPPKPAPGPDPLAMLEKAAAILKPRGGDGEGAMAALLKGIDLGKSFAEGGGEPGMASMFMEGIKTLKQTAMLQPRPAQRRVAAPGTVPAQPAPAIAAPPNKPAAEPVSDEVKALQWIAQQAAFLVIQAKRDKSPALYAELFVDNLPPFLPADQVLARMKEPGAVSELSMINGDVSKYPEWFEEFRAAVVEFLQAETIDPPPPIDAGVIDAGDAEGSGASE